MYYDRNLQRRAARVIGGEFLKPVDRVTPVAQVIAWDPVTKRYKMATFNDPVTPLSKQAKLVKASVRPRQETATTNRHRSGSGV